MLSAKQKRTNAATLPSPTREDEEFSDVSLATFCVFDNEGEAFRFRRRIPGGGCGCSQGCA
jgi:hypothetical protein